MDVGRSLLVVSALSSAFHAPASAQDGRHGGWVELGLGTGSASFSCDTCNSGSRLGGWTFSLGVGGTTSPHIRVGAQYNSWMHGLKGDRLPETDAYDVLVTYYPRIRGGPLLEGGVGFSHYALVKGTGDPIEPVSHDTTYNSGTGWGFTLGVGWEVPAGRRDVLRASVAYSYAAVGALHSPDGARVATGWKQNLLSVEIRFVGL